MSFAMHSNDNIVIYIIQREFIISFIVYTYWYKVVCRSEMFSSNRTVDCFGVCLWRPIYTNFSYQCFITIDKSKLTIRSLIPRAAAAVSVWTAQQQQLIHRNRRTKRESLKKITSVIITEQRGVINVYM